MKKIKTFEAFNFSDIFKKKKDTYTEPEPSVCLNVADCNNLAEEAKREGREYTRKMLEETISRIVLSFERGDANLFKKLSNHFTFRKSQDNECYVIEFYDRIYDEDYRKDISFMKSKGFKLQFYEDGTLFFYFKVPITEKNSEFESNSNFR
jgi:hypothetical protein